MSVLKVPLGEVVEILSGFAFKSELFNDSNGMPLIRIRDVVRGYSDTRYSGTYADQYVVQNGEIVIGMDGNFNAARWGGGPALLNQRVCKISAKADKLDDGYLFYFLPLVLKKIEDATPFVTVKHLSASDLTAERIPLPPLAEQRRVAAILDQADVLRAKRREALAQLDCLAQSIFIEMFGDPVRNSKKWMVKKLKEISVKIVSGTTPSGGSQVYVDEGVAFFRSQNVWKKSLLLDDIAYIDYETHRKMSKSSLRNKDILVTKTGRINTENSSLGRAAIFTGADNSANINGHVYLVRLKEDSIHDFVLYILTTDEYREYIRSVCVGGIDKRQINKEHLEEFPIIFPPTDLQRRFAAFFEAIENQKGRNQLQLADLDRQFFSLQRSAFQGEL